VGVTRMLEAMREVCPGAKFYQASSSEMFGKVLETPQTESTPFYPRSPYGVAKAYGHFITVNYRESYDLFGCSGILFNHECVRADSPLVVRLDGHVAVRTPRDLVPLIEKGRSTQSFTPERFLEVWDGLDWTPVRAITATRRRAADPDHRLLSIEARGGIAQATAHHKMLDEDYEPLRADAVEEGARLALGAGFPASPEWTVVSPELAEFLGLMAADGYVAGDGSKIDFANNDWDARLRVGELWSQLFLGTSTSSILPSGFSPTRQVEHLRLNGVPSLAAWLREQLYTPRGHKQVPPIILNADRDAQDAFLRGHYVGDGLKKGKGQSVKTNSPVLAQGLCWLYHNAGQPSSVYAEHRDGRTYYQLNLRSAVRLGAKGQHLARDPHEVRRIVEVEPVPREDDFVFDLETASGVFAAGIGRLVVHNSPRRGLEFVTRKITWHAAAIRAGKVDELRLGNLDAKRDWGYALDYVEAMWLMLQQDQPEDFVIATGHTHTVRECVEVAFDQVGLEWEKYVVQDDRFLRPAEVDLLVGDCTKAKRQLGWEPRTTFEELIRLMTDADVAALAG
jgi:GDPmannose 4,6-dehydratase